MLQSNKRQPFQGIENTNSVFRQPKDIYYLPAYLRLKVKNFTEMNLDSLDAKMNATIIFTVYYGDIEQDIVDDLLDGIVFLFNRDDALELKDALQVKIKHKQKQKMFTYTIRKIFSMRIESNIFWSPFEIIDLILTITVQSVRPKDHKKKWEVKFNLMDHHSNFLKVSYSEEGTFGNYDLAEALLKAQYTNNRVPDKLQTKIQKTKPKKAEAFSNEEKKNQQNNNNNQQHFKIKNAEKQAKQQQIKMMNSGQLPIHVLQQGIFKLTAKKPKNFQYAHFTVPLYKFPTVTIATIFLPLWLLGIINLGIFFQNQVLADRIASIAALMIAFVALIPTIRQQIPPSPTITFIQILVYLQTFTSFLCLIHSLDVRTQTNYQIDWVNSGLFWASAIITLLNIIAVFVLFLLHKLIWQPGYNRFLENEKDEQFQPSTWRSPECDQHFKIYNEMQVISEVKKPKTKEGEMKMTKNQST